MKTKTILMIFLLAALALAFPVMANAAENDLELDAELKAMLEETKDARVYEFPKIEPEYRLGLGFHSVDSTGYRSLMRFGELDSSAMFLGEVRAFHFPHRLYFVYDHEGTEDYFGELRYAVGDTVFLRWVGSSLHRNPESVVPVDADPLTAFPGVSINDADVEYGVRKNTEDMFLRLKYPDMATHLYVRGWMVHEEGTIQERTLLGSGWFNEIIRDTSPRDYKWETHEYTLGANSHLGPVEIELEHTDSEFKMNTAAATSSVYNASVFEAAGTRDHHLYPDSDTSGNSIKLHTSYTGRLVASTTMATRESENKYSRVSSDYTFASTGITWMPHTSFTMFLKYKMTDLDYDNSLQSAALGIKNGLSSTKDDLSLTLRFRPAPELVLKGLYRIETIKRDNALEWSLQSDKTTKTSYMLAIHSRQARKLKLMADYTYQKTDDPAYNTEADDSHSIKLSADWNANEKTMTFGSYTSTSSKREDLLFSGGATAKSRETYRDNVMLGLTYMPLSRLSTTLSYNYYLNSIKQDLVYDTMGTQAVSPGVLYEDIVNRMGLDLSYMANEKLSLRAGASYTTSEGSMKTNNQDLIAPVSVTSFSRRDVSDTTVTLGGQYEIATDMSLDAEYLYRELSEDYINMYDAIENGDVQVAAVRVTKKW